MSRIWHTPPERRVWEHLMGRVGSIKKPQLRPIEVTIVVLLASPGEWFVVDQFRGNTGMSSPVRQALWRRGFEVAQRLHDNSPDTVQVWARWTHAVPSEVAPWEVQL